VLICPAVADAVYAVCHAPSYPRPGLGGMLVNEGGFQIETPPIVRLRLAMGVL